MYRLRFQKAHPDQWGDIHVVIGDIHAVKALYDALLAESRRPGPVWKRKISLEVTSASDPSSPEIFSWGRFHPPGTPLDAP